MLSSCQLLSSTWSILDRVEHAIGKYTSELESPGKTNLQICGFRHQESNLYKIPSLDGCHGECFLLP